MEDDHVKARAHLSGFICCVVETILLRPAEKPLHARHWTLFVFMYVAFFSVSRVRTGRV